MKKGINAGAVISLAETSNMQSFLTRVRDIMFVRKDETAGVVLEDQFCGTSTAEKQPSLFPSNDHDIIRSLHTGTPYYDLANTSTPSIIIIWC